MDILSISVIIICILLFILHLRYIAKNSENFNKLSAADILKNGGSIFMGTVIDVKENSNTVKLGNINYFRARMTISVNQNGISKEVTTYHMMDVTMPIMVDTQLPVAVNFTTGDCALHCD